MAKRISRSEIIKQLQELARQIVDQWASMPESILRQPGVKPELVGWDLLKWEPGQPALWPHGIECAAKFYLWRRAAGDAVGDACTERYLLLDDEILEWGDWPERFFLKVVENWLPVVRPELEGDWRRYPNWEQDRPEDRPVNAAAYALQAIAHLIDLPTRSKEYSAGRTWAQWESGFKRSGCGPSRSHFYRMIHGDNPQVRSIKVEGTNRIRLHNGDMQQLGWKWLDR